MNYACINEEGKAVGIIQIGCRASFDVGTNLAKPELVIGIRGLSLTPELDGEKFNVALREARLSFSGTGHDAEITITLGGGIKQLTPVVTGRYP